MDLLELKFKRVCEAMIRTPASMLKNGGGEGSGPPIQRPPGGRPCVTWADDPGGCNFTASPRLLQRLQGCSSSPRNSPAGQRRRPVGRQALTQDLDNRPTTPSARCRRFFFNNQPSSSNGGGLSAPSPSASNCSSFHEVAPPGTGTNLRRLMVAASTSSTSSQTSAPLSHQQILDNRPNLMGTQSRPRDAEHNHKMPVSPNLAAKVLFSRPLSVNFRNAEMETFFEESDFVTESVQWHNLVRQRHQAQPLTLTPELCQSAQEWANFLAHNDTFYHRNPQNVGENLFHRWSCVPEFDIKGREAVDYWYSGIRQYNFNAEPDLLHLNAGHFSQLVWRSSSEIGVGKARARGGKFIVVTHYRPQGNIAGQFKENVLPPIGHGNDNDDAASNSDASGHELSSPEACSTASST